MPYHGPILGLIFLIIYLYHWSGVEISTVALVSTGLGGMLFSARLMSLVRDSL